MTPDDLRALARWAKTANRFQHHRTQAIVQGMAAGRRQKDVARENDVTAPYVRQVWFDAIENFQRATAGSDDVLANRPIEFLDLPQRVINALHWEDIRTVGDLTRASLSDLCRIPTMGVVGRQQVIDALARYRLGLCA